MRSRKRGFIETALGLVGLAHLAPSRGRQGPPTVANMKLDFVPPAQKQTALAPMPSLKGAATGIPWNRGGGDTGVAAARRDKRRRRNIQKRISNRN